MIRDRYRRASRKEKGRVLEEFTKVAGYHWKAAIRLLGKGHGPPAVEDMMPDRKIPELAVVPERVEAAVNRLLDVVPRAAPKS